MNTEAILAAAAAYRREHEAAQAIRDPREHIKALDAVSRAGGRLLSAALQDTPPAPPARPLE